MDSTKVIITKKNAVSKKYSFENEVGLSTYDLAFISIGKIIMRDESASNNSSSTSYLI